jgi:predicted hydrocarbon binding protein
VASPEVPIDVDPETGIWSTDGQPMVYLPRHFFVNHHDLFAQALGREAYEKILYEAGYRSAWQWCEREAATHGLRGIDVFRHYLLRLSQRGWGRFTIERIEPSTGEAGIRLDHSIYVCHHGRNARHRLCYAFAGWFPGALEWVAHTEGLGWKLTASEVTCAADGTHDACRFEVRQLPR